LAAKLHFIWQKQGRLPSEILGLNRGERAFVLASTMLAIEEANQAEEDAR